MQTMNYQVLKRTPEFVLIEDLSHLGGRSITNAAEAVVADLVANGVLAAGMRLFYYDTEGDLDEIKLAGDPPAFETFAFLSAEERAEIAK